MAKAHGSPNSSRDRKAGTVLRLVVFGILVWGLAIGVTGCGNATSSTPTTTYGAEPSASSTANKAAVPILKREGAANAIIAQVKDKQAAEEACSKMQRELGLQLEQLGEPPGELGLVTLQYGQVETSSTSTTINVVMCAVTVGSGDLDR